MDSARRVRQGWMLDAESGDFLRRSSLAEEIVGTVLGKGDSSSLCGGLQFFVLEEIYLVLRIIGRKIK